MQEELDYHWDNCRVAKGAHFEHLQINLKYFLICKLFCVILSFGSGSVCTQYSLPQVLAMGGVLFRQ